MHLNPNVLLAIPLLPLVASVVAGLGGRLIGRAGAHTLTCLAVGVSCVLSLMVLKQVYLDGAPLYDAPVYSWLVSDGMHMEVGFLIDRLTALMIAVVTFVSLCVHVYTIGYMSDDPGYTRFFSYISLFTFSMLMLVMANSSAESVSCWARLIMGAAPHPSSRCAAGPRPAPRPAPRCPAACSPGGGAA